MSLSTQHVLLLVKIASLPAVTTKGLTPGAALTQSEKRPLEVSPDVWLKLMRTVDLQLFLGGMKHILSCDVVSLKGGSRG
jgi:hypothetical protein